MMDRTASKLAMIIALAGPLEAGAESYPHAGLDFFKEMIAYRASVGALSGVGCLSVGAATEIGALNAGTAVVQKEADAESISYMRAVARTMPGNGKCDGGFEAVAKESELRRQRTMAALTRWKSMGARLAGLTTAHLIGANLVFVGDQSQAGCLATAMASYAALAVATARLHAKMRAVHASLEYESTKFAEYRDRHFKLHSNCGQIDPGSDHQRQLEGKGAGTIEVAGTSVNPQSDVTGLRQEPDLEDPGRARGTIPTEFSALLPAGDGLPADQAGRTNLIEATRQGGALASKPSFDGPNLQGGSSDSGATVSAAGVRSMLMTGGEEAPTLEALLASAPPRKPPLQEVEEMLPGASSTVPASANWDSGPAIGSPLLSDTFAAPRRVTVSRFPEAERIVASFARGDDAPGPEIAEQKNLFERVHLRMRRHMMLGNLD